MKGNRPLSDIIHDSFAHPGEIEFVREELARFGLPEPTDDDVVGSHKWQSCMTFIDFAGVMLRVSCAESFAIYKYNIGAHDNILQPLYEARYNDVVFSIYPGVSTPAVYQSERYDDAIWTIESERYALLSDRLRQQEYCLTDILPFNIGYLPHTLPESDFPAHPVAFDIGDINMTAGTDVERLQDIFKRARAGIGPSPTPVQDAKYGSLRQAFKVAASGNEGDRLAAWHECVRMRNGGVLRADWADHEIKFCSKRTDDTYYHRKLKYLPVSGRDYDLKLRQSTLAPVMEGSRHRLPDLNPL